MATIPLNRATETTATSELMRAAEALVVRAFGDRQHQVAYLISRGWREHLGRGRERYFTKDDVRDGRQLELPDALVIQIQLDAKPHALQFLRTLEDVRIASAV